MLFFLIGLDSNWELWRRIKIMSCQAKNFKTASKSEANRKLPSGRFLWSGTVQAKRTFLNEVKKGFQDENYFSSEKLFLAWKVRSRKAVADLTEGKNCTRFTCGEDCWFTPSFLCFCFPIFSCYISLLRLLGGRTFCSFRKIPKWF